MIQLPDLFSSKLAAAPLLAEGVRRSFETFEPWLEQSGMPFFPGFTDHSPRHINQVLATAASIVSDGSHELLTAEDVAVLCMSILLHDCGMHLTQDMFRTLAADSGPAPIKGLGDLAWSRLWTDYLSEANRFGQEKLVAVFGDAQPLRIDELNLNDLSERDCLLIGEFVRRHHARLAHEIAVKGICREGGEPLKLLGLDAEFCDIAGLIARSHGLPVRATFDYIVEKYGLLAEYKNVKIPYLIAILRIADYVQVKSERAIKTLLSVKELRSPISRQEWKAHFSVQDVSTKHADPEALYVHAKPADVKMYLKLAGLFADIQRELDESWGALGEVYGRLGGLANLGLSIRRVRSNLDNRETFAKNVSYIPLKAGFDTSGPDLLKLLVGPLYDYEFSVGVRELVQNAVDACRELIDLRNRNGAAIAGEHGVSVKVEIEEAEDRTGWLTVTDTGIGMTLETVTKYFLIAGASFRNSDIWKRQHMDDAGVIKITRGGRFGVGALAAFLIGEEMSVKTRHSERSDAEGIEFTARIDEPVVELRRCAAPSGTSIRVWISDPKVMSELRPRYTRSSDGEFVIYDWPAADWFRQAVPEVIYKWDGFCFGRSHGEFAEIRKKDVYRPLSDESVPHNLDERGGWNALEDADPYQAILWQYLDDHPRKDSRSGHYVNTPDRAVVNGIHVQNFRRHDSTITLPEDEVAYGPVYSIARPSLSIYDPSGVCPINLQRNAIAFSRMGIDERLGEAILIDHFRRLRGPMTISSVRDLGELCKVARSRAAVNYKGQLLPFCVVKEGVALGSAWTFAELRVDTLFHFSGNMKENYSDPRVLLESSEAFAVRSTRFEPGAQANLEWFRGGFTFWNEAYGYSRQAGFLGLERTALAAFVTAGTWRTANEKGRVRRDILESIRAEKVGRDRFFLFAGDMVDADPLKSKLDRMSGIMRKDDELYVWKISDKSPGSHQQSMIMRAWMAVFGGLVTKACD